MPLWLAARGAAPYRFDPNQDVVIGRDQDCDLFLYSSMLSRRHASVRWQHGVPVLFDLDSLNGTFMGPDRIRRRRLQNGDIFRLGDIRVLFRESDDPPEPPADSDTLLLEDAEPPQNDAFDQESSLETRIFSRSHAFHADVFKYNELEQLRRHVSGHEDALTEDEIAGDDLGAWFARDPATRVDLLLHLLRHGVVRPSSVEVSLNTLPEEQIARYCELSQRGGKLRRLLSSGRATWNEMASLRYQSRRSPIFHALRLVARAYRPGVGLEALDVPALAYELETIYAADLEREVIHAELRHMQALGVLRPVEEARWEAWYPPSWETPELVEISPRGLNLLQGFRLEDNDT